MIPKSETDWYGQYMGAREELDRLRAIVTNLIGVPPLCSNARGEGK